MRLLDDRPGSASRNWMVSGVIWMAIGTTMGLLAGTEMAAPDLVVFRYLSFGRVRPMHVDTVWYGFLSMVLMGAGLHYVPQLCKSKLYSEKLANLAMWIWNLSQVAGFVTLSLGYTTSHEYAEYVNPIPVLTVISIGILAYVTYRTIKQREEPLLYVSIWYYFAALLWTLTQYLYLNAGPKYGINDAVWTWFYGHNIFGLWITPLSIGAAYYTIPREVRQPLYSHTLSLLGFWLLVTDYAPTGTHHLLQAPIPAWQKAVAIVHSVLLLIPVYVFLSNIWLTIRGRMSRLEESMTLKFVFAGTLWYFVVSTQGSIQSLMAVQRLTHFTNWVVGHSHAGLLGFAGFIAVGVMYDILPQVTGRPIWSARLVNFQYWLMLLGQSGFMIILTIAGLIQGGAWLNGEEVYRVIPEMHQYMVLRAMSGLLVVVGAIVMCFNVWMTIRGRTPDREPFEPAISVRDITPAETGG